jgi:cystathionine beta-synthase
VEGIGGSCPPAIADFTRVRYAYNISDEESFSLSRELLKCTGVLAGSSSGTLLAAALRYCRHQTTPKRVVSFVCDTGSKYLSRIHSDFWMFDQGFLKHPRTGDLRDLISRTYEQGGVITVTPDDTLLTAFQRMRIADVSQVPVMENGECVGVLDESDLLYATHRDTNRFRSVVRDAMTPRLETLCVTASLEDLYKVLDRGLVALIVDQNQFVGLITRSDMLSYLRRQLQ